MFYNVPEEIDNKKKHTETAIITRRKIYQILSNDMSIPQDLIFGNNNPAAEIRIDFAYRIGHAALNKTRPITVKFLTKTVKDIILSKEYIQNLRDTKKRLE